MSTAIILPARYASTRLPAKPLLRETGKFLIQHVYEVARQARCADRVIVATDDVRILEAVQSFSGEAMMTRIDHVSGTDRIAEVAETLDADIIVNLQGDEPQFDPNHLDTLVELLRNDPNADAATLMTPIRSEDVYLNPNCVKVVADADGRALYFSRSPIPMVRDGTPDFHTSPPLFHLHLGVYAYRREALLRISRTPAHPLELTEKLEQLRILATGGTIRIASIPTAHPGIDTPEDYARFVAHHSSK
ncbi:MAG: 3-deoxy-manno-octulosonate cytidylyltransferase [Fimbriiglobus sp.]